MELGVKKFAKPFCAFSSITKEEKKIISKVLKGEIEDIYTLAHNLMNGYVVREEEGGLLFTLGYYVNCRPDKLNELHQLLDKLERP